MIALSEKAYGICTANVWQRARHFVGLKSALFTIAVALSMGPATDAVADEAPCPAKFATASELEACLNDKSCSLAQKFPVEIKRRTWAIKAAETHVLKELDQSDSCVPMQDLLDSFDASINACGPDEVFNSISAMLWKLKNRDKTIVSSAARIIPETTFTLADKGSCK